MNVDLDAFAGGALSEKFNIALEQVVRNLLDTNTSFKTKRKITVEVEFLQNEERNCVDVFIACKAKLAPQTPVITKFAIGKDLRSGSIMAEEYGMPRLNGSDRIVDA